MNEDKGMEKDVQMMTQKLMALGYPVVPHTAWIKKGNISENIISNLFKLLIISKQMTYSLFQPDEVDAPHPMIAAYYWSANWWSESVLAAGKVNKQVKWRPSKTTADSNTKMAKSLTYKSRPKKWMKLIPAW